MNRTFISFIVTQILSLIGSRMTGVAIGIQVFQETGDTAPILIAAFFAELPLMLVGGFAGILADKWNKKWVIILGDVGQAVGTLLLLLSFSSGAFQLWHLYTIVLLQGVFVAIQSPAGESAITLLVPENQRDRANGIRQIGFPLAGVVAPVFAGIIFALGGFVAVVSIDLLTFIVAVLVMIRLTIPSIIQADQSNQDKLTFRQQLLSGWRFISQRRGLLVLVLYLSFVFFLINGPLELAIPYMLTLTGSEAILGLLLGAMSGGALAGGLAITLIGNIKHRVRLMLLGYFLLGVFLTLYGIARTPLTLGITIFCTMFPLPFNGALFSTIIQNKTPIELQGRVFAMSGQLFTFTTPLSFLLTAYLVDNILEPMVGTAEWQNVASLVGNQDGAGMGLVLVAIGMIIIVATIIVSRIQQLWQLEARLPNIEWQVHNV